MTRDEALKLLNEKVQNKNLIKHCLAVEACMKEFAGHFSQNTEQWGLAGLLHDIDYETTKDKPQEHSIIGAKILEDAGLDKEIVEAVRTHNEAHGLKPESLMAKTLLPVDPLTGLIVASTLVLPARQGKPGVAGGPSKKIADLTVENILNRFKEKGFAKGANREIIAKCVDAGLSLEEFVKIGLSAMQKINIELGL
ncbi:MAG: HDIG domain-containing metalloprotein [Patescibacteria group bacterium]